MVVRLGLAGSDTLTGTRGHDVLVDIGGSNTLSGLAGNDAITGGSDGDTAYGGTGNDLLLGWGGADLLDGGDDGDRLWGGGGDDSLIGGSGQDVLDGGSGRDTAVYDGDLADYRITELGAGVLEVHDLEPGLAGDDGTDRLTGVERLIFADGEVIVGQQPNRAPGAVADSLASQAEDASPRTIAFAELTGNDGDPDGDALTVSAVGNATGGTVAIVAGEVVFTADADFSGAASFDYTVSDGKGGTDTATASFTVTAVNDAPEAGDDTLEGQAEDASPRTIAFAELTANDDDDDGDALTISDVGNATGGTVAIVAGEVVFTADADFSGTAAFDYTVSDGKGGSETATASFAVTAVNDAPEAADDTLDGQEQGSAARTIAFAELTGNDTDVDGDGLIVTAVGNATGGTVSLDGGTVVFVADAGFSGNASFDYTVGDGKGASDSATASFDVTPVDDGPSLFTDGDDIIDLNAFDLGSYTGRGATDALAGDDVVTLSTSQNLGVRFNGNLGNDTILGTGDADWIEGGSDADRIEGGADRDTLDGGAGADSIVGGNGADTLLGGSGDDHLDDDFGNDRLFGGNGGDTLTGGRGNDDLYGGAGADSIVGGTGTDTVFYEGAGVQVNLGNAADNRFGEAEGDVLTGIEGVEGTAEGDVITGNAFINPLSGNAGNDTLNGAGGNDFLLGGAGDDTLTGGSGLDGFVFAPGGGSDRVTDFVRGEDVIDLKDYADLAFADLVLVADPDDTVIDLGASSGGTAGADLVRIVGVTTLAETDFVFAT